MEKTNLLAGGLNDNLYQTPVYVILKENGQTLAGKSVSLAVINSDINTPALLSAPGVAQNVSSLSVVTDANGKATAFMASSKLIGATAKVKASYGEAEQISVPITMQDAIGEMSVEADSLPADGQSAIGVYLSLNYQDESVNNHEITFIMSRVWDSNGEPVQPINGSFVGYGSISTAQSITDDIGLAYGTYTAGTMPGVIEFAAVDNSILFKDPVLMASLRLVQLAEGTVKPRQWLKSTSGGSRPTAIITFNTVRVKGVLGHQITATNTLTLDSSRKALNNIWFPQAQIEFRKGQDFTYTLSGTNVNAEVSEGVIDAKNYGKAISDQVNLDIGSAQAGINVLFVRSTKEYATEGVVGWADVPGHWAAVSDGSGSKAGAVLGHEIGHSVNENHILSDIRDNIMHPVVGLYGGRKLTKAQCDRTNQYVRSNQSAYNK